MYIYIWRINTRAMQFTLSTSSIMDGIYKNNLYYCESNDIYATPCTQCNRANPPDQKPQRSTEQAMTLLKSVL